MPAKSVMERFFPGEPHHLAAFRQTVEVEAGVGMTMLDLGCGDNASFAHLRRAGRKVWGTDFREHPALVDPESFRLMPPDGTIPFPDATFDVVTAVWVLEHVEHTVPFLSEIRRVLKPGGVFLGHSINGNHYVTWIRRLFDLVPHAVAQRVVRRLYGRAEHDTFPTRYRLNTRRQLTRAAREAGLLVSDTRRYADPGYFAFSRFTLAIAVRMDYLLDRLFSSAGRIYFSVAMHKPHEAIARAA